MLPITIQWPSFNFFSVPLYRSVSFLENNEVTSFCCCCCLFLAVLVGSQFPNRGSNQALKVKVPNPNHWTTRELQSLPLFFFFKVSIRYIWSPKSPFSYSILASSLNCHTSGFIRQAHPELTICIKTQLEAPKNKGPFIQQDAPSLEGS